MESNPSTDVVALVLADHRAVRKLFADFESASGDERVALWRTIVRELAVHETAEEEIVHPAARRYVDGGDDIVEARLAEESAAKQTLADLERLDIGDPNFTSRFRAFSTDVLTHADREEQEELAGLRASTSEQDRERMGKLFGVAKSVAPTHGHAHAPESATGNVVVGPVVALMDRVRDAIRDAREKRAS
jgi:hemerythrin superfamily protein